DPCFFISGLKDSKKLAPRRREELGELIRQHSLAFCIAQASVEEIDTFNILNATFMAMQRAISGLDKVPDLALIDGNRIPPLPVPAKAIVKGDVSEPAISAASILAKVERDRIILNYHQTWPMYRFDLHKSYATRTHLELLTKFGPLSIHRRSFSPVAKACLL
ncbi:MAG: ribonuclease HII, partial [Pseudomonadota bacterium]|nr:ribonuclease HII [Pseudomonadota bacterium]